MGSADVFPGDVCLVNRRGEILWLPVMESRMRRRPGRRLAVMMLGSLLVCLSLAHGSAAEGRVQGAWERSSGFDEAGFVANDITAIDADSDGTLWVGTSSGLVWTGDKGRNWHVVDLGRARPMYGARQLGRRHDRRERGSVQAPSGLALTRRHTITCFAPGRKGMWVGTLNGLCLGYGDDKLRQTWYVFSPQTGGPGPEIWSVAEHNGVVWVSARGGVYRSTNWGRQWTRLSGNFPDRITAMLLGRDGDRTTCFLAGFNTPARYGGGADILYSGDHGTTWEALRTDTGGAVAGRVSARVHKLVRIGGTLWACTRNGLARSETNGASWKPVAHRSGLVATEVFDLINATGWLWAGTNEGLFFSRDNGKTWRHEMRLNCPVRRVLYRAGHLWLGTDGGLLRRTRGVDADWRSFSLRSQVLCAATIEQGDRRFLWVGSGGGLSFSWNAGKNWRHYSVADGLPSNRILSLASDDERIWAGTDGGIWTARNNGEAVRRYNRRHGLHGLRVHDIALTAEAVWAATNRGLSILQRDALEWRTVLTSKDWRGVCVADGLVFGAIAKEGGRMALIRLDPETEAWQPLVLHGQDGAAIHQVLNIDSTIWVACDTGLFRSRDKGETWARFASESLWSSRITRMAVGGEKVLYVQAMPSDPPAPSGVVNATRNGGRTWEALMTALPGHANALATLGDGLIVGTRDGLSVYRGFQADLRPARRGWLTWNCIAALAASTYRADRLGRVSGVDAYAVHAPTFWLGSDGAGVLERGIAWLDNRFRTWDVTGMAPLDISQFSLFDGEHIHAIAAAPQGVWFGTSRGVIFFPRLGRWQHIQPSRKGLCGAPVRAVAVRNEQVWLGTDNGLSVFDTATTTWRTFRAGESLLPNNRVTALVSDGDNVWGGTEQGGFRVGPSGGWRVVLPEERVFDIALGSARQYFATDRGVFALDRTGRVRRQLKKSNCRALADNRVYQVFLDGPELWAATRNEIRKILYDQAEPEAAVTGGGSERGGAGVLVVVNTASADSVRVGRAYAELRKVPPENICRLECPVTETVRRNEYEHQIRRPIWRHLRTHGLARKISFLVTTRGVPLRVAADFVSKRKDRGARMEASVDSELMLLSRQHALRGWLGNPYLHREETFDSTKFGMYLVTRLDGPHVDAALGLAARAVAVEQQRSFGSRGYVRFDLHPVGGEVGDAFNNGILCNYRLVRRQGRLSGRIGVPERTRLPYYRPSSCYNTFFYLGWGVRQYDPRVYSWVRGGVAVCLDPLTAPSLRHTGESWVAGAVGDRLTATIGMVHEAGPAPYLCVAGLYRYLMAGFTWAEAAYMCIPQLSWQAVVIGDPLYTPFR